MNKQLLYVTSRLLKDYGHVERRMRIREIKSFLKGEMYLRFENKTDWNNVINYLLNNYNLHGDIEYLKSQFDYYNCMRIGINKEDNSIFLIRTSYYSEMDNCVDYIVN